MVLSGAMLACPSIASQRLKPEVQLNQYFSDNALLAPSPQKQSEWITEILPTLTYEKQDEKSTYTLGYQLHGLYYAKNTQPDKIYNRGFLHVDQKLKRDRLKFLIDGRYTQEILFPQSRTFNNLRTNDIRTQVGAFQFGPDIKTAIGPDVKNELQIRYGQTQYISQDIPHSQDWYAVGKLRSDDLWQKVKAELQYRYRNTKQSNRIEAETISLNAILTYLISTRFSLLFQAGYEDSENLDNVQQNLDGFVWFAGISYRPTRRTQMSVQRGERSFGKSTIFSASTFRRRHRVSVTYNEDITTSAREQLDNTIRSNLNNLLVSTTSFVPTFVNNLIVNKRLEGEYRYTLERTQLVLDIFQIKNNILNTSQNEQGKGVNVSFLHSLQQRTQLNLTAGKLVNRFYNFEEDKRYSFRGVLSHQISRPLYVTTTLQHFINHSSNPARDTNENIASLGIRWVHV